MEAFSPVPPAWTEAASHATQFCCPRCGADTQKAKAVWINRRSPVYGEDHRRKLAGILYIAANARRPGGPGVLIAHLPPTAAKDEEEEPWL